MQISVYRDYQAFIWSVTPGSAQQGLALITYLAEETGRCGVEYNAGFCSCVSVNLARM